MTVPQDTDGWYVWDLTADGTWPSMWPPIRFRPQTEHQMVMRAALPERAANRFGNVHGAFLAGLAEHSVGVFLKLRGIQCVTISLAFDYPASARCDRDLEGLVTVVRETGRMQFLRIELAQGDDVVIHGIATLRKLPA